MNKYLVIFDIDGTLTQTVCSDSEAYKSAFKNYFKVDKTNDNWDGYRYSTDSGLAIELFEKHLNRSPEDDEIKVIKNNFISLFESNVRNNRALCRPLPGADIDYKKVKCTLKSGEEAWVYVSKENCNTDKAK